MIAEQRLLASSALTGEEQPVGLEDVRIALAVPTDSWTPIGDVPADSETIVGLAHKGVLVSDDQGGPLAELRAREERLRNEQWHPHAATFHFLERRRDVDNSPPESWTPSAEDVDVAMTYFARQFGSPPPHFHALDGSNRIELPRPSARKLDDLLRARRTVRSFESAKNVSRDQFSILLSRVFGCHGYVRLTGEFVTLRKSSPSGGGLHPIEAYPLIVSVDGIDPGLYHYNVEAHALDLIEHLPGERARELIVELTAGQTHFAGADALVVLTGRFYRSFWKYRRSGRAYAVLLMDAGHLSQTFYLACTDLGLGAFVTAAVNATNVDERLGLDGCSEGTLAICGCGVPGPPGPLDAVSPYIPGETTLDVPRRRAPRAARR